MTMDKRRQVISHGVSGSKAEPESAQTEEQQTRSAYEDARALTQNLMERICESANLDQAYKKVKANKGSAGVDRMGTEDLLEWLRTNREKLVKSLLEGAYTPQPVKGVKIPKSGGGTRQLGVPTVVDRLIQQAILQVLEPILEPTFSSSSYGFRPRRSAHDAIKRASEYVKAGNKIVVDIDLEKFFDRVNHDILMSRLARRIGDKRLLKLIRRYLQAGMMEDGVCKVREEGTPQGGPLSPLLSNLMLDDLDKELERRGHKFCRYADDCNIYVRSQLAGERVMSSITEFLSKKLRLKVNKEKSSVSPTTERKFLGHRLLWDGRMAIAPQSLTRMKNRVREITSRSRGRSMGQIITELNQFLVGWVVYFRFAKMKSHLTGLDEWIRHRLRCYRLKQCKRRRSAVLYLQELGVSVERSWLLGRGNRWWRLSNSPAINQGMSIKWFAELGLVNLVERYLKLKT